MSIAINSILPREGRQADAGCVICRNPDEGEFGEALKTAQGGSAISRTALRDGFRIRETDTAGAAGSAGPTRLENGSGKTTDSAAWARTNEPNEPKGNNGNNGSSAAAGSNGQGGFLLPMQHTYSGPPVADTAVYPMHPVWHVPMVSEADRNAYIHPMQATGVTEYVTSNTGKGGGTLATTTYRVSPQGMQDFVTSDGIRHRFDVEVVFPEPGGSTWAGQNVREIHQEVGDFAASSFAKSLEDAGFSTSALEIEPFRMFGGVPHQPWFMDNLRLTKADGSSLLVSMNTAMRDPRAAVDAVASFLEAVPS